MSLKVNDEHIFLLDACFVKYKRMKKVIFFMIVSLVSVKSFAQQTSSLTPKERDAIIYMREEEKLARDVYDSMYMKWGVNPFGNIRQSEQIHMDRMKALIERYKLPDPVSKNNDMRGLFSNALLKNYYHELVSTGSQSLTEALSTGAKIEELDIADLQERIKQTDKPDILATYNYLTMASENHLRAFTRRLKMMGINYEPVFLSKTAFAKIISAGNTRGGYRRRN